MTRDEWGALKHLKARDFEKNAPDGSNILMVPDFVYMLDAACDQAQIPFVILKGYVVANPSIASDKQTSHARGFAADILVTGNEDRLTIFKSLLFVGFTTFTLDEYHIHVERDPKIQTERLQIVCLNCSGCK